MVDIAVRPDADPVLADHLPEAFGRENAEDVADLVFESTEEERAGVDAGHAPLFRLDDPSGLHRSFDREAWQRRGAGLPGEWTQDEARYAAHRVFTEQNGPTRGRPEEILTGEFGGARLRLRVRNGQIMDVWAAPGGRHPDGPAPAGRVLATAEVRPPVRPLLRSLQAQFFQSYEARRVQEPGGDTRTVLTVRVQLRAEGLEGSPALVEQQLDLVRLNAEEGVRDVLNQGQRLPNGDLLEVAVRFVDSPQEAHHVVEVQSHTSQEHAQHWGVNTEPRVIGHEVGHLLGLADEYRRQSAGPRPVYPEFGLMTAPGRDEFGRVWYDAQHPVQSDNTPPVSLRPHNLNELGSVLDRVFGTAPRPVPAGEFPMRAAFGEDARRSRSSTGRTAWAGT